MRTSADGASGWAIRADFKSKYEYDALGRRIRKTVNGTSTWFLWDNVRLLAEFNGSGARHEKPIAQLMIYALALSQRTGLDLFDFVCAWFDENSYFEFYPRHVVEKRRRAGLR